MKKTTIEVPEINDCFLRIIAQRIEYALRFTYNDTFDYWSFGLYTPDRIPIVQGIKIVPNAPLNVFDRRPNMPSVLFLCESKLDRVGRYDFSDGNAEFCYVEAE